MPIGPTCAPITAHSERWLSATERLRTALEARARAAGKPYEDVRDAAMTGVPAGRFGDPREFGAVCAFLCSVHAGYIAGQNVLVDGGAYPGTF